MAVYRSGILQQQQWPADPNPYSNPSWDRNYSGVQIIPPAVPPQPTIIQQMPADFIPPLSYPVRYGHAKEDLVDLMMIQNAQMHQVIMNNMTMSALSSFGYGPTQPTPVPSMVPVQLEDDEPLVYHHHYEPYPAVSGNYIPYPAYPVLPAPMPQQEPTIRHLTLDTPASPTRNLDLPAVPPPPPLSATGTVGADIPPATGVRSSVKVMAKSMGGALTEYYDLTGGRV